MPKHIPFNVPPYVGSEPGYMQEAMLSRKLSGDGPFTKRCQDWMKETFGCDSAFLTTSCTHALELAAMLCGIGPGDEVIMPSFTFSSTANAFALRGATVVFVDIRPDTMNIDERLAADAVTPKTKAIVPVHYAGSPCDLVGLSEFARERGIMVVEDAAQAFLSWAPSLPTGKARHDGDGAKGSDNSAVGGGTERRAGDHPESHRASGGYCGTLGDIGCFSFHESKNLTCGEGGAILIKDQKLSAAAEIIREKGTNRSQFFRGEIDRYTWTGLGSSYLPSELNAAYLWAQLVRAREITDDRLRTWKLYYRELEPLAKTGAIELPAYQACAEHNAHIFYIKLRDGGERDALLWRMKAEGIDATFHYVPLHASPQGRRCSRFHGEDRHTTKESSRLLRLPLYYGLPEADALRVAGCVQGFAKPRARAHRKAIA